MYCTDTENFKFTPGKKNYLEIHIIDDILPYFYDVYVPRRLNDKKARKQGELSLGYAIRRAPILVWPNMGKVGDNQRW